MASLQLKCTQIGLRALQPVTGAGECLPAVCPPKGMEEPHHSHHWHQHYAPCRTLLLRDKGVLRRRQTRVSLPPSGAGRQRAQASSCSWLHIGSKEVAEQRGLRVYRPAGVPGAVGCSSPSLHRHPLVFSATTETTAEKATGQMGYQQALLKETQCKSGWEVHSAYRMRSFYMRGQLNLWLENKIQPE